MILFKKYFLFWSAVSRTIVDVFVPYPITYKLVLREFSIFDPNMAQCSHKSHQAQRLAVNYTALHDFNQNVTCSHPPLTVSAIKNVFIFVPASVPVPVPRKIGPKLILSSATSGRQHDSDFFCTPVCTPSPSVQSYR